jgi:hypothetical protein
MAALRLTAEYLRDAMRGLNPEAMTSIQIRIDRVNAEILAMTAD